MWPEFRRNDVRVNWGVAQRTQRTPQFVPLCLQHVQTVWAEAKVTTTNI